MTATLDEILNSHRTHRPIVMGVLNVTPDSFSDGARFFDAPAAIAQAGRMIAQGADVIDVGAESTRPGSQRVDADEQVRRLRDVLPRIAASGAVVSIDTTLAPVARFALDGGASIINDVSAGKDDPEMFPLAARRNAAFILMHMLGEPRTMQENPHYDDVVADVRAFLAERLAAAERAGVPAERVVLDPGIGFGKRLEHNLAILANLQRLARLGRPILVGPSRKRFIGELTGRNTPGERGAGTVSACLSAWRRGATIFRVHDVAPLRDALTVELAIEGAAEPSG